jgi:hypothetical protein
MRTVRRVVIACLIGLAASATPVRAQDDQIQPKFLNPNSKIVLYSDTKYRGISKGFDKAVPNLASAGFNNVAASLSLQPGEQWQICEDTDYRNCQLVKGDVSNLQNLGLFRRVSSIRPASSNTGGKYVQPLKGRSATFFPTPWLNNKPILACPSGGNSRRCMEAQTDNFCRKSGYREGAYFSNNRDGYLEDVLCLR